MFSVIIVIFVFSLWYLLNKDRILSVNTSANAFFFGKLGIYHKDWSTYFAGTDKPSELCYDFYISNNHSPVLLDLLLAFDPSICSVLAFPSLEILIMLQFPINLLISSKRMFFFITQIVFLLIGMIMIM